MAVDTASAAALIRSETRIEILKRLRKSPATKYDLREALDCSRTTVDRNLEWLVEAGMIEQSESRYALRTCGAFVLEQAIAYIETEAVASRLQPFLEWVSREDLDIDLRALADAELTVAGEVTPVAMVDKHIAALKTASHTRMVLPIVSTQSMDAQSQAMQSKSVTAEIVVTPAVAEVLQSNREYADLVAEMRETGTLELSVTDKPVPYYLGLLDETVQLGVDDGEPKALLESENETVREWAEQRFEAYQNAAVPLAEWGGPN